MFKTLNTVGPDTRPKMVCFPSNHGVLSKVMKNWEPLVPGPELATATCPR